MKRALAAMVFLVVPLTAYFSGRNFAHTQVEAESVPARVTAAVPVPPPATFAGEEVGRMQPNNLFQLLRSSARERKDALVREACAISDPRNRNTAISDLFKCFAMLNTKEAVSLLETVDRDEDKIKAIEAVIKAAPSPATPAMVTMLMNLPGPVGEASRDRWLSGQLSFWSAFDPVATAQFVDAHLGQIGDISRSALISNWAAVDPLAAEAWLAGHPDLTGSEEMISDLVYGLYQHDPEMAQQYVSSNASDERFKGLIGVVAGYSFLHSTEAAEKFINSLPDAAARRRAIGSIAGTDLEFLAAQKGSDDHLPVSVADWILKFPPEDRPGSIALLTRKWQMVDSTRLFHWMRDLDPEHQEQVISEYAASLDAESLSSPLALPDPHLRARILRAFLATGGATAAEQEQFVKQLSLPNDVQKQVLAHIVK